MTPRMTIADRDTPTAIPIFAAGEIPLSPEAWDVALELGLFVVEDEEEAFGLWIVNGRLIQDGDTDVVVAEVAALLGLEVAATCPRALVTMPLLITKLAIATSTLRTLE
jgi:hypothetical protein